MSNFVKDYGAFIAALLTPIAAVFITIWYQNRQMKRGAKMKLFMDLISTRDQVPVDYNHVLALNRIDVVFHGQRDILRLWHEYFDLLCQPISDDVHRTRSHKRIELLSAIGKHLGYDNLQQVSLDKYYQPQSHFQWSLNAAEIQVELLRVLKSTDTLFLVTPEASPQVKQELKEAKKNEDLPS
jgi:hypothetical protein